MIGAALELAKGALGLVGVRMEERWVPVAESGDRWAPRPLKDALEVMAEVPVGSRYSDGEPMDGIVSLRREIRFVSEWTEV